MAFNFTIPGIPIVYYGDEIGMPGAGDPDNRRMMTFENLGAKQKKLKNQIRRLAEIRRNSMALLYGDLQIIDQKQFELGQFAFQRSYLKETILIAFNNSEQEMIVHTQTGKRSIKPKTYKIYKHEN